MSEKGRDKFNMEACLRSSLDSLGEGWDLEIVEALIDEYKVNFSVVTEETISAIESGLREMLGSAADIFIDNFYAELKRQNCPILLI